MHQILEAIKPQKWNSFLVIWQQIHPLGPISVNKALIEKGSGRNFCIYKNFCQFAEIRYLQTTLSYLTISFPLMASACCSPA